LSCCQRKELEYCFECEEFPCKRYDSVDQTDSFITHKNQLRDLKKAKQIGIEVYQAELNAKISLLNGMLQNYDDGRRKSFYYLTVNMLDLQDTAAVVDQIASTTQPGQPVTEKAKIAADLFEKMATQRDISLKLRK